MTFEVSDGGGDERDLIISEGAWSEIAGFLIALGRHDCFCNYGTQLDLSGIRLVTKPTKYVNVRVIDS